MSDNRAKIQKLAKILKNNPEDSFAKFALALELLKNNQVETSLKLFESIYRHEPEYLGVYYHLGKLYQALDRYEDAFNCFREGVAVAENQNEQRTLSELKDALDELEIEKNDD
jgi:tetratricopeptide (TPR) repeat protein